MFDISWGKLVIIGVVALLVIGPKELPAVLRQLGQWMTKIRRMAAEFQGQFNEAMREAEMADLKKTFDETTSSINSALDPAAPLATPATSTPEAAPPSDPVALGTAPVAPVADLSVPMPELPPAPETKDFADATSAPSPSAPAPAPKDSKSA